MMVARFDGDVGSLIEAYDKAHALIGERGGAGQFGELRHHCATTDDALYIIGVWESEEHIRARWSNEDFKAMLESVGFPSTPTQMTILQLHAIGPPL